MSVLKTQTCNGRALEFVAAKEILTEYEILMINFDLRNDKSDQI